MLCQREERLSQERERKQKQKLYLASLNRHKVPVYVTLEQNFRNKEQEAAAQKRAILQQIKRVNQPINFEELDAHQAKMEEHSENLRVKRQIALINKQVE